MRNDVQNREAESALPSSQKTFRVRGIPHSCKRNETEKITKAALGLDDEGPGLKVYSLAFNPYREGQEKVATISFAKVPSHLSNDAGRDEWQFPLPTFEPPGAFDEDDDKDTPRRDTKLVIDTHFKGFTPLRSFQKASDHKVEYVIFLQYNRTMPDLCSCIAISGLGGHAFGSFKEKGGTHMWLRDSLPHDLPGARILIYGYDSRLESSQSFQDVRTLAGQFRNHIKAIRVPSAVRLIFLK
jgi:hypothetical protein